jgi:uncharacterized protein YodC (DUF2158 family)
LFLVKPLIALGMTFQRGDLVRLKTGGPVMTVVKIHYRVRKTALVECRWSVDEFPNHKMQSFPPESLELFEQ